MNTSEELNATNKPYTCISSCRTIAWWQWPNALAVDAALIACAWQFIFAKSFNFSLSTANYGVLFLSVWLAYTGDRWLDGRQITRGQAVTLRHSFAQNFEQPLFFAWAALLIINVSLAFYSLNTVELLYGLCLLTSCIFYTALAQHPRFKQVLPKELLVALQFALGSILFALDEPIAQPFYFALAAICFCLLCLDNCCLIARLEQHIDRLHQSSSMFMQYPNLTQQLSYLRVLICIFACMLFYIGFIELSLCIVAITLFYGVLSRYLHAFAQKSEDLRILIDGVLLLPLIFLFF